MHVRVHTHTCAYTLERARFWATSIKSRNPIVLFSTAGPWAAEEFNFEDLMDTHKHIRIHLRRQAHALADTRAHIHVHVSLPIHMPMSLCTYTYTRAHKYICTYALHDTVRPPS